MDVLVKEPVDKTWVIWNNKGTDKHGDNKEISTKYKFM
jgi:hypothetical protein